MLIALATACALQGRDQESLPVASSRTENKVALRGGPAEIVLHPIGGAPDAEPRSIEAHLRSLVPGHQVYLQLIDVEAKVPPAITYNVYLNLPPGKTPTETSHPHYVGTLNFFDAQSNHPVSIALNLTPYLDSLLSRGSFDDGLRVMIVPIGDPESSEVQIARLQVIAR